MLTSSLFICNEFSKLTISTITTTMMVVPQRCTMT